MSDITKGIDAIMEKVTLKYGFSFTKPELDEKSRESAISFDTTKTPILKEITEKYKGKPYKDVKEKVANDIFEHIRKARLEAEKQMIETNMIIIDQDLAMTNEIYFMFNDNIRSIPPMIFGMEVKYQKNLTKDFGMNFIVTDGPTRDSELELLRKENAELKEQIRKMKEVLGVC